MTKRYGIISYTIILLLALISSYQSLHTIVAFRSLASNGACWLTADISHTQPSITTPSLVKDKIRVRYMGGECGYEIAVGPALIFVPAKFIERKIGAGSVSFISTHPHYLFKLRGPPATC